MASNANAIQKCDMTKTLITYKKAVNWLFNRQTGVSVTHLLVT